MNESSTQTPRDRDEYVRNFIYEPAYGVGFCPKCGLRVRTGENCVICDSDPFDITMIKPEFRHKSMNKKLIKAIFIGQDGSLGYRHEMQYTLHIHSHANGYICIWRAKDEEGYCDYESISAFLNNWDNILNVTL